MTIEILEGQSKRLYSLVAPLVMDRNVLRQNNRYPFWTSPAHVWFVALGDKKEVMGFFPVEVNNGRSEARINNYYVAQAKKTVFQALMKAVVSYCNRKYYLSAVVLMPHREIFEAAGFRAEKEWRLYVKMEYGQNVRIEKTVVKRDAKKAAPKKTKKTATKKATAKTAKKTTAASKKTASKKTTAKKAAAKKAVAKKKTTTRKRRTAEQTVADRIAAAKKILAAKKKAKKARRTTKKTDR